MARARTTLPLFMRLPLLLGLLAVAVRVAVPLGYMVAPQAMAAGLTPIVLCTEAGNVTAFMNADGEILSHDGEALADKDKGVPSDHDRQTCAFAGQIVPLAAQSGLVTAVAFLVSQPTDLIPDDFASPGRGLAAPPPPKTGPPIQI